MIVLEQNHPFLVHSLLTTTTSLNTTHLLRQARVPILSVPHVELIQHLSSTPSEVLLSSGTMDLMVWLIVSRCSRDDAEFCLRQASCIQNP